MKAIVVAILMLGANAQAKKPAKKSDPASVMAATIAKYATPGEQHKQLERQLAGAWSAHAKMWTGGERPLESDGVEETKAVLSGRYFEATYKGSLLNQPFEGRGTFGYDVGRQKYFSYWIDSFSTWPALLWGSWDAATKTYTYTGETFDPARDTNAPIKYVLKVESDSKHTLEIYGEVSGKETKMMEIAYSRK